MPSGSMPVVASPIWPIIDSRPMVGVENRARSMAVMPESMKRATAADIIRMIHHFTERSRGTAATTRRPGSRRDAGPGPGRTGLHVDGVPEHPHPDQGQAERAGGQDGQP